ncbi:hypothetical protein [Roseiconus lacunae]|uniref:hypothetical protein n=1 Tax=Roseiconus lacunae TaxID=2605694 RepID=UPI001E3AE292|nr:hypothetical protein [Roseiconus lacunae]MCD0458632.1 hypothetical protein [Roseiconus lacunae]
MRQADLNRSVARATGETVSTIARLGFIIADPTVPIDDPHSEDLGPLVIDWDSMHEQRDQPDAQTPLDLLFA